MQTTKQILEQLKHELEEAANHAKVNELEAYGLIKEEPEKAVEYTLEARYSSGKWVAYFGVLNLINDALKTLQDTTEETDEDYQEYLENRPEDAPYLSYSLWKEKTETAIKNSQWLADNTEPEKHDEWKIRMLAQQNLEYILGY